MSGPYISRPRQIRRLGVLAVIGGLGMFAVAADTVQTVKTTVVVRADKNPFSPAVETVLPDTQLTELGRDGGWVHVRTPSGKEGFIKKSSLPSTASAAGMSGAGGASSAEAAAAGRGLEPETEGYAKGKKLSPVDAQQMVDWGKLITDEDLQKFGAIGHVGPAKFRN